MLNKGKVIQDISLLYELSLAVSSSLDFQENCEKFLTLLMARKKIAITSVWLWSEIDQATPAFASPSSRILIDKKHDGNFIRDSLKGRLFFRMNYLDDNYEKIIQEKDVEKGHYAIFNLNNIGFLKMTTFKTDGFTSLELNQLANVIKKFAISIEGSKAYDDLKIETEKRIKAQKAEQQFLAHMSHEIRNPMHAVIGSIQMLNKTELSDNQKEHLNSLQYSSNLLLNLLDNILDLSKIEAGELAFENKRFDLEYLLKGIINIYDNKVKDNQVKIILEDCDFPSNYVYGDPTRVNQILVNLMSNAVKFTKKGEVKLSAKIFDKKDDIITYQFKIQDTGLGISKENILRVFDKFKQVDAGMNRKFQGTGLGLAIVKELVHLMNGSIQIESEINKGTLLTVHLPFRISSKKINHIEKKKSNITNELFEHKKFLIVEDDEFNQKIITLILKSWNCKFDLAKNGEEAVNFSLENKYDMILMDIHMPIMNGIDATKNIRLDSNQNHNSPIVAMTASALREERSKALDAGMNAYLTKPFSSNQLKSELTGYFEK